MARVIDRSVYPPASLYDPNATPCIVGIIHIADKPMKKLLGVKSHYGTPSLMFAYVNGTGYILYLYEIACTIEHLFRYRSCIHVGSEIKGYKKEMRRAIMAAVQNGLI